MEKIYGLSKFIWSLIFLTIQVIDFGFLVGAMGYDYWFFQKWKVGTSIGKFKGNLLGPYSDLTICSDSDSYHHCYNECDSYCERYEKWYSGGVAYVFFDSIGSIITVLISVILVLDMLNLNT